MSNSKIRQVLPWLITFVILGVLLAVIFRFSPSGPVLLEPGEVQNYQGENLSAIANVYENAIAGTQHIDQATYRLNITGYAQTPLQLTYDEIISNYQTYEKVVTIHCVEGWSAKILWQGVLVSDLLYAAGANMSASIVIFRASDGYSTALPMDYIVKGKILLAYKMNNVTIPEERGFPFELVAESQYGYKWIKWVTEIEVSNNTDYLGYWESRGFPNNATIPNRNP
jgi:DMSO/TMAO reductase YedYZ molybdopterin-dependent catalytic subunit